MLKKIRQIAGIAFFILTTLLFLDFTGTVHLWFDWMAKTQLLPAILATNVAVIAALIALTLFFGRIYCSVICPLGVFQDIVSWIASKRKKRRLSYSPALSWLRYVMLCLFVAAFVAGIHSVFALLEPYSAYGRIASNLFAPVYRWGNNVLAYLAEHAGSYAFYSAEVWLKGGLTFIVAVATLAIIGVLAWRNGLTYCNTVCPAGTVLGFVSRFALLKPVIDTAKCNGCRSCTRNCKASCINEKEHRIDYSRCVACMDCIGVCKQNAINYKFIPVRQKTATAEDGVSRRNFFTLAVGFGVGSLASRVKAQAPQLHLDGGLADIKDKQQPARTAVILPPGSQSARQFAQHCTGCQLCVSVCPNQVLRPSKDWLTAMQPYMSFERGYCRPECTKCAEVCPTGAIRKITAAEKSSIQIGHAVWLKDRCIVYTDESVCDNCARHCPTAAIAMIDIPGLAKQESGNTPQRFVAGPPKPTKIPAVDTELCIGCGTCENLCPARPLSAIFIEGHIMHKTV
jgi:ferredoxin